MKSKNIICILFISIVLLAISAFAADDMTTSAALPMKNLPDGFKLLAVQTATSEGVNMTEEISDFFGAKDIGLWNATKGIYVWAPLGQGYDSIITLLTLSSEEQAKAAISNYMSQPKYQLPPYRGIDRFSSAIINGHNATEIRDAARGDSLRFLYLWNNENTVVLVEGNDTRSKSMELASATEL
jgi:hypothetical protein